MITSISSQTSHHVTGVGRNAKDYAPISKIQSAAIVVLSASLLLCYDGLQVWSLVFFIYRLGALSDRHEMQLSVILSSLPFNRRLLEPTSSPMPRRRPLWRR